MCRLCCFMMIYHCSISKVSFHDFRGFFFSIFVVDVLLAWMQVAKKFASALQLNYMILNKNAFLHTLLVAYACTQILPHIRTNILNHITHILTHFTQSNLITYPHFDNQKAAFTVNHRHTQLHTTNSHSSSKSLTLSNDYSINQTNSIW